MAYVVTADGQINNLGLKPDLKTLQGAVGGLIERVCLGVNGELVIYVNEEGMLKNLPVNAPFLLTTGVQFLGDVVVMEEGDEEE